MKKILYILTALVLMAFMLAAAGCKNGKMDVVTTREIAYALTDDTSAKAGIFLKLPDSKPKDYNFIIDSNVRFLASVPSLGSPSLINSHSEGVDYPDSLFCYSETLDQTFEIRVTDFNMINSLENKVQRRYNFTRKYAFWSTHVDGILFGRAPEMAPVTGPAYPNQ